MKSAAPGLWALSGSASLAIHLCVGLALAAAMSLQPPEAERLRITVGALETQSPPPVPTEPVAEVRPSAEVVSPTPAETAVPAEENVAAIPAAENLEAAVAAASPEVAASPPEQELAPAVPPLAAEASPEATAQSPDETSATTTTSTDAVAATDGFVTPLQEVFPEPALDPTQSATTAPDLPGDTADPVTLTEAVAATDASNGLVAAVDTAVELPESPTQVAVEPPQQDVAAFETTVVHEASVPQSAAEPAEDFERVAPAAEQLALAVASSDQVAAIAAAGEGVGATTPASQLGASPSDAETVQADAPTEQQLAASTSASVAMEVESNPLVPAAPNAESPLGPAQTSSDARAAANEAPVPSSVVGELALTGTDTAQQALTSLPDDATAPSDERPTLASAEVADDPILADLDAGAALALATRDEPDLIESTAAELTIPAEAEPEQQLAAAAPDSVVAEVEPTAVSGAPADAETLVEPTQLASEAGQAGDEPALQSLPTEELALASPETSQEALASSTESTVASADPLPTQASANSTESPIVDASGTAGDGVVGSTPDLAVLGDSDSTIQALPPQQQESPPLSSLVGSVEEPLAGDITTLVATEGNRPASVAATGGDDPATLAISNNAEPTTLSSDQSNASALVSSGTDDETVLAALPEDEALTGIELPIPQAPGAEATAPTPPGYAELVGYLSNFEGGSCFLAVPQLAAGGEAVLQSFGQGPDSSVLLLAELTNSFAAAPAVFSYSVTGPQCAAIEFISARTGDEPNALSLTVANDVVVNGQTLAGQVADLGEFLHLLVVDETGKVFPVDSSYMTDGGGYDTFDIPLVADEEGLGSTQLLVAISTRNALVSINRMTDETAPELFAAIEAELKQRSLRAVVSVAPFEFVEAN